MQFTTFILAAIAAVSVTASPVAAMTDDLVMPESARALADATGETLTVRQIWCGKCSGGKQICCSATGCYAPTKC